jgi:hypothetical protein
MAFSTVADGDGINHQLCQQDLDNSCACASVAMVVRKIKSTGCDEQSARRTIDSLMAFEHSRGQQDWNTMGTLDKIVASALSKYKVTSAKTWDNVDGPTMSSFLQTRCTKSKPGIAFVEWDGGGGHAIVCLGKNNAGTQVLFLDPAHNAVVPIAVGSLPRYAAPYGDNGAFKSWLVTTV